LLADGGQERIALTTIRGLIGYRITKFQLMPHKYGLNTHEMESTVKIYKVEQTTVDEVMDFSDNTLLAAGIINMDASETTPTNLVTVFDNELFNQDIYITHHNQHDTDTSACNYYIELEQMDLALDEATVTTLKNLRNND